VEGWSQDETKILIRRLSQMVASLSRSPQPKALDPFQSSSVLSLLYPAQGMVNEAIQKGIKAWHKIRRFGFREYKA
jgi:hypothetical protein